MFSDLNNLCNTKFSDFLTALFNHVVQKTYIFFLNLCQLTKNQFGFPKILIDIGDIFFGKFTIHGKFVLSISFYYPNIDLFLSTGTSNFTDMFVY